MGPRRGAVVGLAVFAKAAPRVPARRIARSHAHLSAGVSDPAVATARFDQMFTWIAEGSANNVPGFDDLIRRGPSGIANATAGFYHAVEYLSVNLKWQGIAGVEAKFGRRTVDVLMVDGGRKELKNLQPGARFSQFFAGQVAKDISAVRGVSANPDALGKNLEQVEYVFRGRQEDNVAVADRLRAEIAAALGPGDSALAARVKITFLGKGAPY